MAKKTIIYLEAMVLAQAHMSGIGHATLAITKEILKLQANSDKFELQLLVPFNKVEAVLQKFDEDKPRIKKLWLPARVTELLMRLRLLPPVDLFIGRGIYIFPNYKNWPVVRSKSITYIHDISFKLYPEFSAPKNRDYLNKYLNLWMSRTDKIITLSKQVKSEIVQNYEIPEDKLEVIYDGVDGVLFSPKTESEIQSAKQKYSIKTDKYLIFVGNKEPRKNLERLVQAFDSIEDELKRSFSLVLVGGGGWLNDEIDKAIEIAKANGADIVSPSRFVDDIDLPALYSGATLTVFIPLYEGFGIPPLESLACGTHVLASDIPVLREVLKNHVEYCDPLDTQSITGQLNLLLKNPKPIYINPTFIARYSWQKCAAELLGVVTDLN